MMVAAFLMLSLMAPGAGEQPVRVWLGTGGPFAPGDRVRVFVQTDADGYLVVLHRRPDGGVDVLFPGDPKTDPFARAGTYEIRGPDEAPVLAVAGPLGRGTVLAALSPDPFRFAEFVRGGTWNAGALTATWQGDGSAEASLTDIVQRMLGDGSFNYDLITYTVAPQAALALAETAAAPASVPPAPPAACIGCSYVQSTTVVVEELPFNFFPRSHHRATRPAPAPVATAAPPALALYRGGNLLAQSPASAVRTLPPIVIVQRPLRTRAPTWVQPLPAQLATRPRDAARSGPVSGPLPVARAMTAVAVPGVVRVAPSVAARTRGLVAPPAPGIGTAARAGSFRTAGWRH